MSSKKKTTAASAAHTEMATSTDTATIDVASAAPARSKKKAKAPAAAAAETTTATDTTTLDKTMSSTASPAGPTLQSVCDGYIASMETAGNSTSTIASYKMDLRVALDEFGGERPLAEITREMITAYYTSPRVTMLKSGRTKAKASIDKTRRVLRLALVWAVTQGWIESAPLPSVESVA